MSNLRNRVMALALSVLTAVTTVAGSVPAWAAPQAGSTSAGSSTEDLSVEDSSAEQTPETAVVNVKIDSAGGSVTVGDGSSRKTVLMQDDGTVRTTDAEGNETVAAVDGSSPYALTLTETKGTAVPVTATASDGYDVSTYTVTFDGGSESVGFASGDTFSYSLTADRDKTVEVGFTEDASSDDADTADTTAESSGKEDKAADTSAYDKLDFSSARLLVGTDDASVVAGDEDDILSSYEWLYLIQYPDAESAKKAYAGYVDTADFVDIDNASLSAADDADITDVTSDNAMTEDTNPLAELAGAPDDSVEKGTIALIDTGASDSDSIVEAVSMLGDDASDDNGHGSLMARYITAEDPDAKILSIKALDANGNGTPSSVTAAIRYAIEKKASIINLSLSGTKTAESSAVEEAVKEAVKAGITVIGAAGNNGRDAKYYIPGGIDDAVIAGAANADGTKTKNTNYGSTVDYYVVAGSTSEAAARLSGIYSRTGAFEKAGTVFTSDGKATGGDTDDGQKAVDVSSFMRDEDSPEDIERSGETAGHKWYVTKDQVFVYDTGFVDDLKTALHGGGRAVEKDTFLHAADLSIPSGIPSHITGTMFFASYVHANEVTTFNYTNISYPAELPSGMNMVWDSTGTCANPTAAAPSNVSGTYSADADTVQDNGNGTVNIHYYGLAVPPNPTDGVTRDASGHLYNYQRGYVSGWLKGVPSAVYVRMHKTGQDGAGSVAGAVYEIWRDYSKANGGTGTGKSFTIGSDGYSDTVALEAGHDYWYREMTAPTNGNYLKDDTWYHVTQAMLADSKDSSSPYIINTSDRPYVYASIHKTGPSGAGSFAGAKYELWYDGKGTVGGGTKAADLSINDGGYSGAVKLEPDHSYWYHETSATASGNYLLDDSWHEVTSDQVAGHYSSDNAYVITAYEQAYFYIRIHKTGVQAAGSVAGAKYELWRGGTSSNGGTNTGATFTIGSNGYSNIVRVDPGHSYWYHEISAPDSGNYLKNNNWYQITSVQLSGHANSGNPYVANTSDTPVTYACLTKSSSNTAVTNGNRCYSLKDGTFVLTNTSTGTKYTLTTDENGNTPTIQVGLGTYHVTETKAPHGYIINSSIPDVTVTVDNVKSNPCHIQVQDTPGLDPVPLLLQKRDAETGKGTPQGAGSLAGAQYTIKYYDVQDADEDSLKDETPLRTWVLSTNKNGYMAVSPSYKVSGDEFYYDSLTNVVGVPIGTILIQETKAPDGYQLNDQIYAIHFNPDANGNVKRDVKAVYATDDASDEVKAVETPQRGGLNFLKYDTDNNPMAGVPFVITSETTGESHVIIADADGRVDTEANKHSNNTNGNDSLVRQTAGGAYVCDDPSKLDASAGVWFGEAAPDDSRMALLYDKYTISEVFVRSINYGKNISNRRKTDTKNDKAGSVLGVVIDTNGKNVSLDPEVWENPDVTLGTTAKNADVESKNIALTDTASVVDTVSYENLTPGDTYTIKGKLVDRDNPSVVVAEAETTITPEKKNGTADVSFSFDSSNIEGKTLVAFEYLNWKGVEIAKHEETGDTAQTVYVPKIRTTLTDKAVEDEVGVKSKNDTLVDTVSYWNLAPHENYIIKGQLIQKSTGKVIATADSGEFAVGTKSMDGTKNVTFTFDSTGLVGETVVAFEKLYLVPDEGGLYELNKHEDIEDTDQSVYFPKIGTTASDGKTKDHVGTSGTQETLVDTVKLNNIVVGKEYTVRGTLVDKKTGKPVLIDNKEITAEGTVTFDTDGKAAVTGLASNAQGVLNPKNSNRTVDGSVDIIFTFDSSAVEGQTMVVFEDLLHKDVEVETHSDITDEVQSVHYPKVRTTAIDKETGDDVGTVHEKATIVDTVQLTNLVPGMNYTVNGTLYDQKSGDIFKGSDGKAVTQKAEISVSADGKTITTKNHEKVTVSETGTSVSGTVDLTFTFDSSLLAGRTLVAFEDLEHNGITVATHSDIRDEGQSEHYPDIHTTAVDKTTGDHAGSIFGALINGIRKLFGSTDADGNGIADDQQQNIVDTVTLSNLVPGKSYVVSGKLMDADTGDAVVIDDKEITASTVITVSENGITSSNGCKTVFDNFDNVNHDVDGSVDLTFILDSSKIPGTETVVFERLYHADGYTPDTKTPDWDDDKDLVNSHEDKDDKGQSVSEVGIHTTAVDVATGTDQGVVPNSYINSSMIEDTVELAKLVPGASYQIRGRLVDLTDSDFEKGKVVYLKSDGSATEDINEAVTVTSDEFKAESENETHKLQLTIGGSLVQGKDITVFEDILHNGVVISSHPAKDTPETWDKDEFRSQTVHYMTGKTNATDGVDDIHSTIAGKDRTIEDRVYFQNLVVGKKYSIEGTLHDKATGEALSDEGATRKVTFTASDDLTEALYDTGKTDEKTDDKTKEAAKVTDLKVTEHFDGTKTISGYVTLTFTVDASELAGHTLVAFEKFTNEGKEIFVHEDLEDLPQTIRIPKIGTTAKVDKLDETALYDENGSPKSFTITDTVSYENLWTKELLSKLHEEGLSVTDNGTVIATDHTPVYDINDGEYTITGKLIDKATGKEITDVNGKTYESSVHFVPDEVSGTVDVVFTLNAADFIDKDGTCTLDGKSLVVYEDLYQVPAGGDTTENNHTAVHHDVDDHNQDIRFPHGQTHATDYTDGELTQEELSALTQEDLAKMASDHDSEVTIDSHEAEASDTMKILDMVSYSNLHAATKYTVTGALQVVTERDENGKAVKWEPAVDDDGNNITESVTFTTPEDEDGQDSVSGYVPVLFSFKGMNLAGQTTVAFEKFTRDDQDVMVHHDINDQPQTDYVPLIHTNATDSLTGNHNGASNEKSYVIDEVSYENLQNGRIYSLSAQLVDKDTTDVFGNAVKGTFTAGTDGQFITPDGTVISNMDDIRKALKNDEKIAVAQDEKISTKKENPDSTDVKTTEETDAEIIAADVGNGIAKGVYVVTPNEWDTGTWGFVHIFDKNPDDGGKLVNAVSLNDENTVISLTDGEFIQYFNVDLHKNSKVEVSDIDETTIEKTYIADMDKIAGLKDKAADKSEKADSSSTTNVETVETDVAVSTDSQNVTTDTGRVSGSVYVVIPVDSSKLGGHTLVAFEKLYTSPEKGTPKEIAHHEDIDDESQSVHYIDVHTEATDKSDGDKTLATSGTVTVVDKVSFKNLIPGKKYEVTGTMMDKKTGKPLAVNGQDITSNSTFTPDSANGYVNMEFTFDVTTVASGDYVVFEKLYDSESGEEIARHEDLNDASQTVTVPARPEIQTSDRPISPVLPISAGIAVAVIIAVVLFNRKRRINR